jgi:aspartate kinase
LYNNNNWNIFMATIKGGILMRIIVQKFGGTSVSTGERRQMVADKIIESINKGYSPVVVVSAIGRKGDPYATDTLLSLINYNGYHVEKREVDLLLNCGEIISAVVMAEIMEQKGYKVRVLTGGQAGILTDSSFGDAKILKIDTNKLKLLKSGIIPIVAGFQGLTPEGDFTTLGRGAGDLTGAALGEAINAELIEIYTDVDGIMTADPRIVPDAKVIEKISYNEVFQLAEQGAKVIHPRAVEYAMRGNVPLLIKNTMSNAPGTVITSEKNNNFNIVTGITHMSSRTQVNVNFEDAYLSANNIDLFTSLAENNVSIDLINVFPKHKIFTVDGKDTERVTRILKSMGVKFTLIEDCSKIAIIGNGMRGVPGVMAKILSVLSSNNIEVLQTADSHNTIWCLVKKDDTTKAINSLHNAFEL